MHLVVRVGTILIVSTLILGACSSAANGQDPPTQSILTASAVPTAQPSPTPVPPTTTPVECPSDPENWTLTENQPGSHLKGLAPQCVYDQLERTAAWMYATTVLGHTRSEAAGLLGISNVPMAYVPSMQLTVLAENNIPQQVEIREYNNHPHLAEWRIDTDRRPGATLIFHGCFDASSLGKDQVTWQGDHILVICEFKIDYQYQYLISEVNGKVLTIGDSPKSVRRSMWFGYLSNEAWMWFSSTKNGDVDLSQVPDRGTATINPTIMVEKYGIRLASLPENWETAVGQEFKDALIAELDSPVP